MTYNTQTINQPSYYKTAVPHAGICPLSEEHQVREEFRPFTTPYCVSSWKSLSAAWNSPDHDQESLEEEFWENENVFQYSDNEYDTEY
jgi:hypothetical protein